MSIHLLSPKGFRAAGVSAGVKSTPGALDVGLLACDVDASAAAVFTTNQVFAAPVAVGREHVASGRLRGIVVNAGNANACTGRQGERDARRMCALAADAIDCDPEQVLPSSTGIIGRRLPMDKIERGIAAAGAALGSSETHAGQFADAILTTDLKRKSAAVTFSIGRTRVTLAGVCKGSGMIGPRMTLPAPSRVSTHPLAVSRIAARPTAGARRHFMRDKGALHATMLAYLTTDALVPPPLLRRLLAGASDASFNCVTVDDHTSTNDTAVLLASGASGAKLNSPRALRVFTDALDEVCQSLAYKIAADGEGATKVVKITVREAASESDARVMARAIANSPLVKCAMHGNDPNWGRIVSAAGLTRARFDPSRCTLTLQKTPVFRHGQPIPFDAAAVSAALDAPEVAIDLRCRLGKLQATCWTCDLSKEYVTINADYHT